MIHRLLSVKAQKDKTLLVVFQNGIEKKYDIRQLYSHFPQMMVFEEDQSLFEQVRIDLGEDGIVWNDQLDLEAEDLWYDGIPTGNVYNIDIRNSLGYQLTEARTSIGMYQPDLAKATGIHQGDISDIERGKANPTIKTLSRLAEGMGMRLKIEFVPKN